MTENQLKAHDRLKQYREAKRDMAAFHLKIEEVESRCNKQTKDPSSIMKSKRNKDGSISVVPVTIQSNKCGNSQEDLVIQLSDMRTDLWHRCCAAEQLCMDIENEIYKHCTGIHARILSLYYLYDKRLEFIAVKEKFSYPHIKRLKWRALEMFGKKMIHNDP